MRPARFLALIAGLAASVVALPGAARAEGVPRRIVVAGPEGDAIANRLQKELTAMGFEPVRVDDAAGCASGAIVAWIGEMHAAGAACSDGSSASVWVIARSGLKIADVVSPRPDEDPSPDIVAVRAAEIARASLELASDSDPAAGAGGSPPPTWSADTPATDRAIDSPKKHRPAPRTPVFTMGGGPAALLGADVSAAALDSELTVRVARLVALSARATLSFDGSKVATARGAVNVAPSIFGLGPSFALTASDSFLIPRLGGGVGAVWLRTSPTLESLAFQTLGSTSSSSSVTSPMAYANAALSLRVYGPLRMTFEGLLGTSAHRLVVRAEGEHVAYWGQPFGSFAMRGELMFR